MGEFVRLEIDGAVGVIRLDRPPVNAINTVIHRELREVAEAGEPEPGDPGGRAVRRDEGLLRRAPTSRRWRTCTPARSPWWARA